MSRVPRQVFLILVLWFAADFAVPFEPGGTRFVIEDMDEVLAAPRTELRAEGIAASEAPRSARVAVARLRSERATHAAHRVARRAWHTPPPLRPVAVAESPPPPDAH